MIPHDCGLGLSWCCQRDSCSTWQWGLVAGLVGDEPTHAASIAGSGVGKSVWAAFFCGLGGGQETACGCALPSPGVPNLLFSLPLLRVSSAISRVYTWEGKNDSMPSCPSWKSACAFHVFCCFPWWGAGIQRQKAVWCSRHTSVKTRQGVLLTGFQSGVLFHIDLFPEDCPFIGHETSFFPSSTLALAQRGAVGWVLLLTVRRKVAGCAEDWEVASPSGLTLPAPALSQAAGGISGQQP